MYRFGKIDFSNLNLPGKSSIQQMQSYSCSKLCNVLFVRELANHLEGTKVTCYSVHPGLVNTEVFRHMKFLVKILLIPLAALFFRTPADGAQTSIYCAVQEGIEKFSGRYFTDCKVQEVLPHARDDAVARKLWEISERMVGLQSQ
ncbi:dehydrogenase/reductase SDR family member 13 [Rhincodon typus]|uniref:dehydrogenase/reductase SDR family member 13 n=1 Tax=Rhincodon typus TaxID=259920 RepID=UPI00202ED739|nr:dehydrogenase/reductase SDR family member 13 [Rhincodon typus]